MTREERLEKKRIVKRLRYQKIKNDPDKYAQQKVNEKEKYEKKKNKGTIKTVKQMKPREQRKARKIWREKAKIRRRRLALQDISNAFVTPPYSDNEGPPPPQNINRRAQVAQQKSTQARKKSKKPEDKKTSGKIAQLRSTIQRYKKQIQRIKKPPIITPNTKVNSLVSAGDKETIKKKLLFSEVVTQQLNENDGVGATCKRTADRLVASGTDISSIDDLAKALKTCSNIKVFTVEDSDITEKTAKLGSTEGIKTFSGTLKVHQVTGCVFVPNCLILKSLRSFCHSELCHHFQLSTLDYPKTHAKV